MELTSFIIFLYALLIRGSNSLLCYNGTLSNVVFGEDPLQRRSIFGPSKKESARLRCSLTVLCREAVFCYNCSSTHLTWDKCGGNFVKTSLGFNNSRFYLVNCSRENAMCFVRSWTARARYSWIVQRGCYQTRAQDPFPRAMNTPTRAMTCRLERLADADYKVCMCNADWCNIAHRPKASLKINVYKQAFTLSKLSVSFYEKDGKKRVLVGRVRCDAYIVFVDVCQSKPTLLEKCETYNNKSPVFKLNELNEKSYLGYII